jgi:type II secretory pathway component PulF
MSGENVTGENGKHQADAAPASPPVTLSPLHLVTLASLTRAGLPLPAGLRAMAEEAPRGRAARALCRLAERLEAGDSLESATAELQGNLPRRVAGLMAAGQRAGRVAEVLEEWVRVEHARSALRHRLHSALAYPMLLVLILGGVFWFFGAVVLPPLRQTYDGFGFDLPKITKIVLESAGPGLGARLAAAGAVILGLYGVVVTGRPGWAQAIAYSLPLFGGLWKWTRLAEFARWTALTLQYGLPLPDGLRLAAAALDEPELAFACRAVAEKVESGRSLAESFAQYSQFPAALRPLVEWGQGGPRLADAFWAASGMFAARAQARTSLLATILPPLMFLLIVGMIGVAVVAIILPLGDMMGFFGTPWLLSGT